MDLGQQALLEPEPPRTVVIPRSIVPSPSWWGVDSAKARVNLGWVASELPNELGEEVTWWRDGDGLARGVQSVAYRLDEDNDGRSLGGVWNDTLALVAVMLNEGIPAPGAIFVEPPTGQQPSPDLFYTVGLVTAAIYEAVRTRFGYVPLVYHCPSTHWKAVAVGQGNFGKNEPKPKGYPKGKQWRGKKLPLEEYKAMKWARLIGYTGMSWDDADALGIAECARRDVGFR